MALTIGDVAADGGHIDAQQLGNGLLIQSAALVEIKALTLTGGSLPSQSPHNSPAAGR